MSTAAMLRCTTRSPRLPYVVAIASFSLAIASSVGSTPASAKKHVCMTVLTRPASPAALATAAASIAYSCRPRSSTISCTSTGRRSQTSSAGYGLFINTVAPGAATPSTSIRSRKLHWCTPTNVARSIR